jgi:hypothetical protein
VQVVAELDVVARQRPVELNGVVLLQVLEVERRAIAGRGEVEADCIVEGEVECRRLKVVGRGDGRAEGCEVDVQSGAWEEAVVGQGVQTRTGRAACDTWSAGLYNSQGERRED